MNLLGVKTWSPASLAGKRAFSGMVVTGLLMIFGCYHTSMSLVIVWTFINLFGVDNEGHWFVEI